MSTGRGGRPTKEEGEKPTKQIRVFTDLVVMIGELTDLTGESVANMVDPMLRPEIEARHAKHKAAIENMKKLRNKASRRDQEQPE